MKKVIYIVLSAMALCAGCVFSSGDRDVLYGRYALYIQDVQAGNTGQLAERYFSKSSFEEIDPKEHEKAGTFLSGYMAKVYSYHETNDGKIGCLAINGFAGNSEPLVLYLAYDKESESWLISRIHIAFVEGIEAFASRPVCPEDARREMLGN